MPKTTPRLYWANALFSAADRAFNAEAVSAIRRLGYDVFLPQESNVNESVSPSATDVFRIDTAAILDCDLMVACIDQETIDCGVACEVGVAHAFNIPVIGLYTDIRQRRTGPGRMYKNLYVLGAIESNGSIVSTVSDVIAAIPRHTPQARLAAHHNCLERLSKEQFARTGNAYAAFVAILESWYEPKWTLYSSAVRPWLQQARVSRILDIGCGPGSLGVKIHKDDPDIEYYGYDISEDTVRDAAKLHCDGNAQYGHDAAALRDLASRLPFDAAIVSFALHDQSQPASLLQLAKDCLSQTGRILVVDLSRDDLPRLTAALRAGLARPSVATDPRLSAPGLSVLCSAVGLRIIEFKCETFVVRFPTAEAIMEYLEAFGVLAGADLPLGLTGPSSVALHEPATMALSKLDYPFDDQRTFVSATLSV